MPNWKEYIDWEDYGINRPKDVLNCKRLGFYKIEDLLKPQNLSLKKKKIFVVFLLNLIVLKNRL